VPTIVQKSVLPQLDVKLLFTVGSAQDPPGKEGLAALTAAVVADGGSRALRIDEIRKAFFPMAGRFAAQVDKEMTTFTASIHRDHWAAFADVAFPMLLEPGFRQDDFARVKDQQRNALLVDLRDNNEEELAKEELQASLFAQTPYGHPTLGTVAGIDTITLDDVKDFWKRYTRAALTVGVSGDASDEVLARVKAAAAALPAGSAVARPALKARRPHGLEVEIVKKPSRAVAISLGHPIEVTRAHPDFVPLWVARTWLGEHRSSASYLFQRIRELRGMNYGDYAYIEAFPGGMFQFFPDPNVARRAQLFEIWIRPVVPENAHMALRIALFELDKLIRNGLTEAQFEATRTYLMKSVYLMVATQDQQLGYALDSRWYGTPEWTAQMRDRLSKLTRAEVNAAVRRHLSSTDLQVVMIAEDAEGLRDRLLADGLSTVKYDAPPPPEILAEDKVIGAMKLHLKPEAVRIVPVEEVFAK
jgi:zinc protease